MEASGASQNGNFTGLSLSAQAQHQMQSALLLNIVVAESAPILQLLPRKDEALLVRWNALLVLNLGLHVLNSIAGLHIQSNSLASESLDEYLHSGGIYYMVYTLLYTSKAG